MTDTAASSTPTEEPSAARRPLRYELPSVVAEQERRSRRLLLLVVRSIFIVLLVTMTVLTIASEQDTVAAFGWSTVFGLILAATALGFIVLVVDAMTPNKRLSTVVGVYIGICFGLIGAVAIGSLIDVIADAWEIGVTPIEDRSEALRSAELIAATEGLRREMLALRHGMWDGRGAPPLRLPEDRTPSEPGSPAEPIPDWTEQDRESLEQEEAMFGAIDAQRDVLFDRLAPPRTATTSVSVLEPSRTSLYIGLLKVIIGIVLCYLSVSVVLTTKDDFRLVIPYVEFAKQVRGVRPLLVDTSALIDGRINDLGQTGFFDAPIIVPQFVIDELQSLADSGDRLKRSRGRRGLDMISRLQANPYLDVTIDDPIVEGLSVDHMLIELADEQKLRILTTDYNLKKVAQIRDVAVLNINDLANTLKAAVAPGETLEVQVVRAGEGAGQGVGFLPDGTMVVIEDGGDVIGSTVGVVVTNSLQTSAGRMIFGKLEPPEPGSAAQMGRMATSQPRATQRPGGGQPTGQPKGGSGPGNGSGDGSGNGPSNGPRNGGKSGDQNGPRNDADSPGDGRSSGDGPRGRRDGHGRSPRR